MVNPFETDIADALNGQHSQPEPLPGHEERFKTRLMQRAERRKIRFLPRWPYTILAAACVAGILVTLVMRQMREDSQQISQARLSDVSYEMAQVEHFYSERIRLEMPNGLPADQIIQKFRQQLSGLEEEYKRLESLLAVNFSNQRVVDAMVENYRFRLKIIEMMQKYIERKNNESTQHNEKGLSS